MNPAYDNSGAPKTLYVGNLDHTVTEELVMVLFNQIGPVKGCKIIRDPGSDPYCFVEFQHHGAASAALTAMNKRLCLGKEMKVNWAASPGISGSSGPVVKVDTSNHHHIFVGDLSPEIDNETLRNAFSPFGEISDCKVVKDSGSTKSKGYGFVSFVQKLDAQSAIEQMNGQWLGSRSIRTNWAARKPPSSGGGYTGGGGGGGGGRTLNYDEVFRQASASNFTVYVGGTTTADENIIREAFKLYGKILEIRYFKDKGYAFVRFDNKESACSAIVACHLTEIGGQIVKCSWGKEGVTTGGTTTTTAATTAPPPPGDPYTYQQGPQMARKRKLDGEEDMPGPPKAPYPPGPPGGQYNQQQYQQYYNYMQQQQQYMQYQQYYGPPGQYQGGPPPQANYGGGGNGGSQ